MQTTQQNAANGAGTGTPLVIQSSYDPEVEFMEMAVTVGAQRNWLVHGPDLSGAYGELQGTGGLDAVVNETTGAATGVISDAYGHTQATVTGTTVTWNPVRSTGYGPAPGTNAAPLDGLHDLSASLAWRGKYIDGTGFYYLGARYYDPSSGTFVSADPLGHPASMSLYDYCNGDPVNGLDPDGRVGKQLVDHAGSVNVNGVGSFFDASISGAVGSILQGVGSIPSVFSQANQAMQQANQQISTMTGGEALLANTLRLPGNFAFGLTSLVNDPVDTAPQVANGLVHLPGTIYQDGSNFLSNPSIYGGFNLLQDGLQVAALADGGGAMYRTALRSPTVQAGVISFMMNTSDLTEAPVVAKSTVMIQPATNIPTISSLISTDLTMSNRQFNKLVNNIRANGVRNTTIFIQR